MWWLVSQVIGGILVLGSYFYYLPKIPTERLWVGLNASWRTLYTISILLSGVAYLSFLYLNRRRTIHPLSLFLFLIAASLWSPSLYYFPQQKWITILSLCLVSATVGWALALEPTSHVYNRMLLGYLLFHVFVMDNIGWSIRYFFIP